MSPQIIKKYDVKSIPSIFFIKNENILTSIIGLRQLSFIKDKLLHLM